MPVFLPPKVGISQSRALAEAYTHAKAGDPALETIALYHSTFVDELGAPTGVYFVNAFEPLLATIEAGAAVHSGTQVEFQAIPIRLVRPEETDTGAPGEVTIELDNVSREVAPYIASALDTDEPVLMTLRVYMASDTSAPHEDPPTTLVLRGITASASTITAKFGYGDLTNRRFPRTDYSRDSHPGLYA